MKRLVGYVQSVADFVARDAAIVTITSEWGTNMWGNPKRNNPAKLNT
jgi:hypothetical protein